VRRLIRPIAAAAICLAGVPAFSASSAPPSGDDLAACRDKAQVRIRDDHWTEIKAPKVDAGEGPRTITDYATPPYARSRIYATNGAVLKISADAGCTWSTMHNAAELEKLHSGHNEQDVYTNLAAPSNGSLWAASYDTVGDVAHPHVYAATGLDDQNVASPQFIEISNGMAPAGKPVALVGSVTQQNLVYVLIEGPAPDPASGDVQTPARHLYVAYTPNPQLPPEVPAPSPGSALGAMWKELALPAGFSHVQGIQPAVGGNGLWLWSGRSYALTPDTLADSVTWTTAQTPGDITAIDVDYFGVPLVAYKSGQGGAARVFDDKGGFTVRALPTAGLVVHGSRPGVYAVSGAGGTHGYDISLKRWVPITPKGVPAFTKMQMPNGRLGRIVLAQAGDTFYRFDTYAGELFVPPPPLPDGIGDWPPVPWAGQTKPTLTPVKQVVTVRPGDLQDVRVDFRVPPAPNPLDVYFLLDTTGSMGPAVAGLKASIANISQRLHKALGKDACFGLGDFRDFYPGDTQHTYVRDLKMTCENPVERMQQALDHLPPAAGGADIPEAQTVALTQAVKGTGSKLPDPPVDRYQNAEFRADAYKVIVLISDSSFSQNKAGYPTKAATINTLNVAEVKVVSALVTTAEGDHDNARQDMEEVAEGTRTLAPPQGVDCDGNHRSSPGDLLPGAPLVCEAGGGSDANIGPAIVGLLLGVIDPGTLAVEVHDTNAVVQQPIKGRTSQVVNLKRPNALAFALPLSCTKAQDGLDLAVGLLPTVRAVPVGLYGEVTVRCRSNPLAPPPPPPAPKPQEEPILDMPRPPRPPVVAAVVQPPPAPAQPLSNINPNAGFSQQEEQQFQLAAVTQDASEENAQEEVELAMSDHRARDAAAAGYLFGGAAVLSTATALAYRRRLQRSMRTRTVRAF
jgi:hypothetical protein